MTSLLSAKSERIVVIALLTLAAVLRITAAVVLPDQSSALVDALAYRELAACNTRSVISVLFAAHILGFSGA